MHALTGGNVTTDSILLSIYVLQVLAAITAFSAAVRTNAEIHLLHLFKAVSIYRAKLARGLAKRAIASELLQVVSSLLLLTKKLCSETCMEHHRTHFQSSARAAHTPCGYV
jgi:hypothetical protein